MAEVPATAAVSGPVLDVCTACHFVWFDAAEYDAIPALPAPTDTSSEELPAQARERLALLEVARIRDRADAAGVDGGGPDVWWKWIPGCFGMPVEEELQTLHTRPWATWICAGLMVLVTLLASASLDSTMYALGLIPSEAGRLGGLTFVTSFFLHAGLFHLIGNLYFFLVFGDNVECLLGRARFLLLLGLASFAGSLAHILGDPRSSMPCVGASGGISGVLAFYACQFPRARLGFLFRFYLYIRWIRLPAYVMFLLWLGLQCFGVAEQVAGFSNVSALAHLGGAAVGVLFWLVVRHRGRAQEQT